MAGVSLAWLLDGTCDVVLLEARPSIGGNVRSIEVDLDGQPFVVDMGAQYFHPAAYPAYAALLEGLGLYDPASVETSHAHAFPASITLSAVAEPKPRFVSPVLPDRWWPFAAPWNSAGVWAFGLGFVAARYRELHDQPWDLTLDEWLPTLGLQREQWEGMLLPWAASLFSGDIEEARGVSARAAMFFAAKVLPPNPFDPISYFVLRSGLVEAMTAMLGQCSTVAVATGTPVLGATRTAGGGFALRAPGGRTFEVDDLVFAASGPPTAALLKGLAGTERQRELLGAMDFYYARLALHTDPVYAPVNPAFRSFLNCEIQNGFSEASMWMASVITGVPASTASKVWKSWISHRARPKRVLHEAVFSHFLPTPATIHAQDGLAPLQGVDGIWFAGGYLYPCDSQEFALRSALGVALGLQVTSSRTQLLLDALGGSPL